MLSALCEAFVVTTGQLLVISRQIIADWAPFFDPDQTRDPPLIEIKAPVPKTPQIFPDG
jgi:hypothetical protein